MKNSDMFYLQEISGTFDKSEFHIKAAKNNLITQNLGHALKNIELALVEGVNDQAEALAILAEVYDEIGNKTLLLDTLKRLEEYQ